MVKLLIKEFIQNVTCAFSNKTIIYMKRINFQIKMLPSVQIVSKSKTMKTIKFVFTNQKFSEKYITAQTCDANKTDEIDLM
jgi:hypothetical protein